MLHGAAKIARDKAHSHARNRKVIIAGLLAVLAIGVATAAISHWFAFGLNWSSDPVVVGSLSNSPAAPRTKLTVRTLALSNWRYRYTSQVITAPTLSPIPLQTVLVRLNTGPLYSPPPGSSTSKPNRYSIPFVVPFVPFAIALSIVFDAHARAHQRARRGCCANCGYNLKGIVPVHIQTTCPECGTVKTRTNSARVVQRPLADNT